MTMSPVVPQGATPVVDLTNPGWGNMQTQFSKSPLKEISATLAGFKPGMSTGNNPKPTIILQLTDVVIAPGGSDVFVTDTTAEISIPHSDYMNSGWGALGKSIANATGQPLETMKLQAIVGQRVHMFRNDNFLFFTDKQGIENRGTAWKVIKILGVGEQIVHHEEPDERTPEYLAKLQATVGSAPVAPPSAPTQAPAQAPTAPAVAPPAPPANVPPVAAPASTLNPAEQAALDAMQGQTQQNWWNLVISNDAVRTAEGGDAVIPLVVSGVFAQRMLAEGYVSAVGEGADAVYAVAGK
jgi:hypothetical protein